ncbi:MAG: hypothetical protein COA47_14355 [Robiginitomaculum sp.]|nr:MAG: hypothetical protein COA47_14355 [Robiginitomaculum sp.]
MTPGKTTFGAILKVNGKLLLAFILGGLAWLVWPSKPEWWGFGVFSIIVGMAALRTSIDALITIAKLYAREKEFAAFTELLKPVTPSEMADKDALKAAGMTDE